MTISYLLISPQIATLNCERFWAHELASSVTKKIQALRWQFPHTPISIYSHLPASMPVSPGWNSSKGQLPIRGLGLISSCPFEEPAPAISLLSSITKFFLSNASFPFPYKLAINCPICFPFFSWLHFLPSKAPFLYFLLQQNSLNELSPFLFSH